jgi:hypothetical protein
MVYNYYRLKNKNIEEHKMSKKIEIQVNENQQVCKNQSPNGSFVTYVFWTDETTQCVSYVKHHQTEEAANKEFAKLVAGCLPNGLV